MYSFSMYLDKRRIKAMLDIQIPELLTAKEIAEILKISYPQALQFIRYSGIDYIRVGNQYRVVKTKFVDFLNKKGGREINIS